MIPDSAVLASVSLAVAAWLLTYLIHSTILLGAVRMTARVLKPALTMEETLWKMALVGAVATALWQTAGLGASPFGHRLDAAGSGSAETFVTAAPAPTAGPAPDGRPAWSPAMGTVRAAEDRPAPVVRFEAGGGAWAGKSLPRDKAPSGRSGTHRATAELADAGETGAATTLSPAGATWTAAGDAAPAGAVARELPAGIFPRLREAADRVRAVAADVPWTTVLALVWALGAALGLARLLVVRLRLRRLLRGRTEITEGRLVGQLDRLRAAAGVRRPVRLSLSPHLAGPVAWGRSEICLPRRVLTDLTPAQQQSVLAHELAHLERGDPGWLWISAVMEAVFFFQPANRAARRRLRDLAEFLCDDWAVKHAGGHLILARCLAEVAGWVSASPALASGMAQKSSPLVRRIERLLENRDLFREPGRPWRWLAGLVLLGAVATAAPGITTGSYQRPDNAPWSPGPSPWPDYPFVLTPPGWNTTPLATSTWGGSPILEGDGQLGELFGYPTGLPAEPPAEAALGYPSSGGDGRFVRVRRSPWMVWRPARPALPAVRPLPPSPRRAVRIRVRPAAPSPPVAPAEQAALEQYEVRVARTEQAALERYEVLVTNERQAEREARLARAIHEHRIHALREAEQHQRQELLRLREKMGVRTAPAAGVVPAVPPNVSAPAPGRSFAFVTGDFRIPSEKLAVIVGELNEHLDRPIAIALGDLAAAVECDAADGGVDLQFRLDRLAELQEEIREGRLVDLKQALESLEGLEIRIEDGSN